MNKEYKSPLKRKDLKKSEAFAKNEENVDIMFEDTEEFKNPEEVGSRHDLGLNPNSYSSKELILPEHIMPNISSKISKTYNTFGLDRIDESLSSPLKIFKYLNKPAENSLHEIEMSIPLEVDFNFSEEHPLLKEIYERVLNEDDYMDQLPRKVFDDTVELLNNEDVNFMDSFNILGIMFILKKLMDSNEVNLSIENNLNLFGGINQSSEALSKILSPTNLESNPYYNNSPKVLTLYHLHLLCSNFNDCIFVIHFNEDNFHSFSELKTDKSLQNLVLKNLKEFLEGTLKMYFKDQFFENKIIVFFSKISKFQKKILVEFHLPYLQKGFLYDLIDCLCDSFSKKYKQSFENVTCHKIFRYCHMKADDIDLWGYKEFKEGLFIEEKTRGGLPYIRPKEGWIRFGLNVTNYYQTDCENDCFGNNGGSKEWAVCYCCIGLEQKLPTMEREIYKDLFLAEEEEGTKNQRCGFGILATFDLGLMEKFEGKESSLGGSSWRKDEKIVQFFKLQTLDIMDANFKSHSYCLALQCRVNPMKIKYPKGFGKKLFVVNDPKDIRPYGILIKKNE